MGERKVANRYKIEEELGRGGMAVVYRAWDTRLKRHVALKLLHPYLATQPESSARFLRESNAIAKLDHPNIIKIYDADRDEETKSQFLVMELVEGPTLNSFIDAHPTLIPETALAMACCLCDAIEHAHKSGIIHRDIKPENIMIASDGTLKLMDFGIARILDAERMTASGSLVGSPAHMPPEIIEGQSYTFTCDIFSLGTVIYYMLTNMLPFKGTTPITVFKAILDGKYMQPSRINQSITRDIDKIVARCLMVNPDERFQNATELKEAILDVLKTVHFEAYADIATRYVLTPDEFTKETLPSLKASLNEAALVAVKEHRFHSAIEYLNCILTYSPNDPEANALLKKLRNGNALRRRLAIGSAALIILFFIGSIIYFNTIPDPNAPTTPAIQTTTQPNYASILEINNPKKQTTQDDRPVPSLSSVAWVMSTYSPYEAMTMLSGEKFADKTDEPDVDFYEDVGLSVYSPDSQDILSMADLVNSVMSSLEPPQGQGLTESEQSTPTTSAQVTNSNADTAGNKPEPNSQANADASLNEQKNARQRAIRKQPTTAQTPKQLTTTAAADPVSTSVPNTTQTPDKQATPTVNPANRPPTTTAIKRIRVTQPVYPPDAFAVINGKRYDTNTSGDIIMDLPPGKYKMSLSCPKRCIQQSMILTVTETGSNVHDIVSLEWADASLVLHSPDDGPAVYFVARRLDDVTHRVYHFVPRAANAINGFNAFGKPIQLEVYAIPISNTLKSYDTNALENAKYASTRVSLSPGETRTVRF